MGVDLLGVFLLVQVLELGLDVARRFVVLVGSWVARDPSVRVESSALSFRDMKGDADVSI